MKQIKNLQRLAFLVLIFGLVGCPSKDVTAPSAPPVPTSLPSFYVDWNDVEVDFAGSSQLAAGKYTFSVAAGTYNPNPNSNNEVTLTVKGGTLNATIGDVIMTRPDGSAADLGGLIATQVFALPTQNTIYIAGLDDNSQVYYKSVGDIGAAWTKGSNSQFNSLVDIYPVGTVFYVLADNGSCVIAGAFGTTAGCNSVPNTPQKQWGNLYYGVSHGVPMISTDAAGSNAYYLYFLALSYNGNLWQDQNNNGTVDFVVIGMDNFVYSVPSDGSSASKLISTGQAKSITGVYPYANNLYFATVLGLDNSAYAFYPTSQGGGAGYLPYTRLGNLNQTTVWTPNGGLTVGMDNGVPYYIKAGTVTKTYLPGIFSSDVSNLGFTVGQLGGYDVIGTAAGIGIPATSFTIDFSTGRFY